MLVLDSLTKLLCWILCKHSLAVIRSGWPIKNCLQHQLFLYF